MTVLSNNCQHLITAGRVVIKTITIAFGNQIINLLIQYKHINVSILCHLFWPYVSVVYYLSRFDLFRFAAEVMCMFIRGQFLYLPFQKH